MRGGTQDAGVSFWKPSCYAGAGIHDIQLERVDKIGDRFFEAASRRLVAPSVTACAQAAFPSDRSYRQPGDDSRP
jgi:hypothetical protein